MKQGISRLNVPEAGIRIVLIVRKGFAIFDKVFHVINWYSKTKAPVKDIAHICNADDLTGKIE